MTITIGPTGMLDAERVGYHQHGTYKPLSCEKAVIDWYMRGLNTRQIARRVRVHERTVRKVLEANGY